MVAGASAPLERDGQSEREQWSGEVGEGETRLRERGEPRGALAPFWRRPAAMVQEVPAAWECRRGEEGRWWLRRLGPVDRPTDG